MDYEFYNKYYLKTREDGAIIDAFSDGPHHGRSTEGYICFNDKGTYQLRLIVDGVETEENPLIFEEHGIPIYKYVGGEIMPRTAEEIQGDIDRIPPPPPSQYEVLRADTDFLLAIGGYM